MAKIIVITSGKGGVGKTTTSAALAMGLAQRGHRTVVIDFDVGLRNLDLIMGCERRVVYDFINVINGEANINQALIRDKRCDALYVLPASQTRDKEALTKEGVGKVLEELGRSFDFIICDSPAGIEHGATMAMYYADDAVVVTNPEVSSVRDSDRMLGILSSKSRRAEKNEEPIREFLLLTRYCPERVAKGEMLAVEDVREILSLDLLGCWGAKAWDYSTYFAPTAIRGLPRSPRNVCRSWSPTTAPRATSPPISPNSSGRYWRLSASTWRWT